MNKTHERRCIKRGERHAGDTDKNLLNYTHKNTLPANPETSKPKRKSESKSNKKSKKKTKFINDNQLNLYDC